MNIISIYKKPIDVIFNPHYTLNHNSFRDRKDKYCINTVGDIILSSYNSHLKIEMKNSPNPYIEQKEFIHIVKYFKFLIDKFSSCRKINIYNGTTKANINIYIKNLKDISIKHFCQELFLLIPIEK